MYPYVVVLQSHLLSGSNVTVVAPVLAANEPAATLTSVPIEFDGRRLVVLVGELTAIDAHRLGQAVATLRSYEDDIRRALERVFTGF